MNDVAKTIPCLSIRPPWSYYVCPASSFMGLAVTYHDVRYIFPKTIENRNHWNYPYRGWLLIHSSKTYEVGAPKLLRKSMEDYPRGAIIGIVKLQGTVIESDSPWYQHGATGLVFSDNKAFLRPINWRGQLGLFEVPVKYVESRLEEIGFNTAEI